MTSQVEGFSCVKVSITICRDNAVNMVHIDGGVNLEYCQYHTDLAIDEMSKIKIPVRVQRLVLQ